MATSGRGATDDAAAADRGSWAGADPPAGPVELRALSEKDTRVYQRTYDDYGTFVERVAGEFVYHPEHDHWHFEGFTRYELWTKDDFDTWRTSRRTSGQPGWHVSKTSSCLYDTERVVDSPDSPSSPVYPLACGRSVQGLSVGWADIYRHRLEDQWIIVGESPLDEGRYVLRSVVDPLNLIHESPNGEDPAREGARANEAAVLFAITDGRIEILEEVAPMPVEVAGLG